VGTERMQDSGYFRAKLAQEELIRASGVPFTIVHSTQFFEFMGAIARAAEIDQVVRLSGAMVQPISADDVADAVTEIALKEPAGGIVEIAGPEKERLCDIVARFLVATRDPRTVLTDGKVRYFGAMLQERSLLPGPGVRIAPTRFDDWLALASRGSRAAR